MCHMKVLIIAVVLVASIAIIASISLVAIPNTQVHTCTSCPNIPSSGQPLEITNLSIEPSTVTLGTSFLIYADIFNPNPYSIYVNNGCISSVSATFDKNVEIQKGISCFSMSKQEIPSLQKIRIHGPSIGTIYNATSVGNTNATITISYVADGSVGTVTTSKLFIVDMPSPTPRGLTLEEQLGLSSTGSNSSTKTTIGDTEIYPFSINVTNADFAVNYNISQGQVRSATIDMPSKSLILSVTTTGNGTLIIDLPRTLINPQIKGQDSAFIVLDDRQEVLPKQIATTGTDRILSIPFQYGVSQIQIIAPVPIQ